MVPVGPEVLCGESTYSKWSQLVLKGLTHKGLHQPQMAFMCLSSCPCCTHTYAHECTVHMLSNSSLLNSVQTYIPMYLQYVLRKYCSYVLYIRNILLCVIYVSSIIRTHLILCFLLVLTYYCSYVMAVTDYVNTVRVVRGGPHRPLACLLH